MLFEVPLLILQVYDEIKTIQIILKIISKLTMLTKCDGVENFSKRELNQFPFRAWGLEVFTPAGN